MVDPLVPLRSDIVIELGLARWPTETTFVQDKNMAKNHDQFLLAVSSGRVFHDTFYFEDQKNWMTLGPVDQSQLPSGSSIFNKVMAEMVSKTEAEVAKQTQLLQRIEAFRKAGGNMPERSLSMDANNMKVHLQKLHEDKTFRRRRTEFWINAISEDS